MGPVRSGSEAGGLGSLAAKLGVSLCTLALVGVSTECALRVGLLESRHYTHVSSRGERTTPTTKLLILGDSFLDRRTRIHALLEEEFEILGVEFLNLAVSGMGPLEYLWELEAYGRSFAPDIVLLSFYVGNDVSDIQYRLEADPDFARGQGLKDRLRPLIRNSYLYQFLKEKREALRIRRLDEQKFLRRGIDPELLQAARSLEINPSLLELAIRRPHYLLDGVLLETEQNARAWQRITEIFDRIRALSDEIAAELIVVIFPHTIQLDASHFPFFAELGFELDERSLSSTRPQSAMLGYCEKNGLRCLDLLPAFRSASNEELYRLRDDHLSVAGEVLSARAIVEFALSPRRDGKPR